MIIVLQTNLDFYVVTKLNSILLNNMQTVTYNLTIILVVNSLIKKTPI